MSQFVPKIYDGGSKPAHPGEMLRADLKAYQDGELLAWNRLRIRWHLAHCAACREELTWLRRLGEDMQDLEQAKPGPHLRARILASLPDASHAHAGGLDIPGPVRVTFARPTPSGRMGLRWAGASALGLLLIGGALALPRLSSLTGVNRPTGVATTSPIRSLAQTPNARPSSFILHSSSVTLPPVVLPTPDETNDAANRIAHSREQAETTREQRFRQGTWNRAVAAARSTAATPALPVSVVLQTSSLASVENCLQTWARSFGGTLALVPANRPDGNAKSAAPTLLAINVPARSAAVLPAVLTKLGDWELTEARPVSELSGAYPAVPTQEEPMRGSRPSRASMQADSDTARPILHPNQAVSRPEPSPATETQNGAPNAEAQKPNTEHRTPSNWVRILIQVQTMRGLNR